MPAEFNQLGDLLFLQHEDSKGYLHSLGREDNYGQSRLTTLSVKQFEPHRCRTSVFVLRPAQVVGRCALGRCFVEMRSRPDLGAALILASPWQMWNRLSELQTELERRGVDRLSVESDPTFKRLLDECATEAKVNDREFEQVKGRALRYGMVVQLQHAVSHKFLTVSAQPSSSDPDGCLLSLSYEAGKNGWFRIVPRLSQVHSEGQHVREGDPCLIEHCSSGQYVSVGMMYEVVSSNARKTSFKLNRFQIWKESMQNQVLVSGRAVLFNHREANGCMGLVPDALLHKPGEQKEQPVSVLPMVGHASHNSNGAFELERADARDGSVCKWTESFRIRHLSSGRLLACSVSAPGVALHPEEDREARDVEAEFTAANASMRSKGGGGDWGGGKSGQHDRLQPQMGWMEDAMLVTLAEYQPQSSHLRHRSGAAPS